MSPLALHLRFLQTQPDQRLLALAREGHEVAFEALVRRYRRELLAYCRRLQPHSGAAEDALQQALLQAWTALTAGAEIRDARPWLYRIAHNVTLNELRRVVATPTDLAGPLTAHDVAQLVEHRVQAQAALDGLASLPALQRQALLSTTLDGASHDEVANALGISSGAVRGLVYRARATLRSAAAVLLPGPFLHWTLRHADGPGPSPAVAELVAGGGGAGVAAALAKGGAVLTLAVAGSGGALLTAGSDQSRGSPPSPVHATTQRRLASVETSRQATPRGVLRVLDARSSREANEPGSGSGSGRSHRGEGSDGRRSGPSGGDTTGRRDGSNFDSPGGSSSGSDGGSDGGSRSGSTTTASDESSRGSTDGSSGNRGSPVDGITSTSGGSGRDGGSSSGGSATGAGTGTQTSSVATTASSGGDGGTSGGPGPSSGSGSDSGSTSGQTDTTSGH